MKKTSVAVFLAFSAFSVFAAVSEIRVDLKLDFADYVCGERIRAVVDIANSSPEKVSVGYRNSKDLFFIEVLCFVKDQQGKSDHEGVGKKAKAENDESVFQIQCGKFQLFDGINDEKGLCDVGNDDRKPSCQSFV